MRYAVILAGGSGTRLWPLSRRKSPKQVRALLDGETLLEKTYARVRQAFPETHVFVATLAEHVGAVRLQLPELPEASIIVEPVARGTAAAIGYAARTLHARDTDAIFVTVNSDAYVRDVPAYLQAIDAAFQAAEASADGVALVGVPPTYAETGYGYIEVAAPVGTCALQPTRVRRFVEKPDAITAQQFVDRGCFLWNPALFVFRAERVLALMRTHLPEHHWALTSLPADADAVTCTRTFLSMPNVSIDVGLMEKLDRLIVIPASFGWADVGHWRAVHDILIAGGGTGVARGTHVGLSGDGNLVVAPEGKLIATYGIEDCIIVDTPDALLICPRVRAQEVKAVVRELEQRGLTEYL